MNSTQRTLEVTVDYNWVSINLDSHISVLDEEEHTKVLRVSFYRAAVHLKGALKEVYPIPAGRGEGGGLHYSTSFGLRLLKFSDFS